MELDDRGNWRWRDVRPFSQGLFRALLLCSIPQLMAGQEVLWEVGDVDGRITFEYLVSAVISPDGVVHALDWGSGTVWRFGEGGEMIGTIGGRGQGPGEFQAPEHIGTLADTVWVSDRGQNRITRFSLPGFDVSTESPTLPTLPPPLRARTPAYLLSSDLSVAQASVPDHLIAAGQGADVPLLLMPRDGGFHREAGSLDLGGRTLAIVDPDRPWNGLFVRNPLGGYDQWAGRPGGGMVVWTETSVAGDAWRVALHQMTAADPAPALRTTLSVPRAPATDREKAPAVEALAQALLRRRESDPAIARERAEEAVDESMEYLPPFSQIVLAEDGAAWLRLGRPRGAWVRVDTSGTMTELNLPPEITVLAVRGDSVVFRTIDELGVHRLGLLRLDGSR